MGIVVPCRKRFFLSIILTNKIDIMERKTCYVAPEIEVIEVAIEKGFAQSEPIDGMGYGNSW